MKRDIRVFGPMKFPHFVRYEAAAFSVGVVEEDIYMGAGHYEKRNVDKAMMTEGSICVVSDPSDKIVVGEEVISPMATYLVTGIVEERPAKGDWGGYL